MAYLLFLLVLVSNLSVGLDANGEQHTSSLERGDHLDKSANRDEEILNLSERLDGLIAEVRSGKEEIARLSETLEEEVSNRKRAHDKMQRSIFDALPLGTILSWVNKPSQDSPHTENMPSGYQLCDGSVITEGVWEGLATPDLTNTAKFLRGGSFSEVLDMEESMMQNHTHIDPGHSHSDKGHSHTDGGHSHSYIDTYANVNSPTSVGRKELYLDFGDVSRTTELSYASIQTSYANMTDSFTDMGGVKMADTVKVGEEVRPTNMRVLFIMKVVDVVPS